MDSSWLIRPLAESDSIEEITELLHAAYRELGELGLRFTAVDQSVERTERRLSGGRTFVAVEASSGRMIGTITLNLLKEDDDPPLYLRPDCVSFGQFGVHPQWQGQGIGSALHERVKKCALEKGFRWLALDTAEPAVHLVKLYEKWGYQVEGEHQWGGRINYMSVLMKLDLSEEGH